MRIRKVLTLLSLSLLFVAANAQENNIEDTEKTDNKEIVKTGYNIGPFPIAAFDADKGFQVGALLNVYDFGDGSMYPNTRQKLYMEASFFTKGSQLFVVNYDNKFLIPGVRWCATATLVNDKAMDFYGFNGYEANYDFDKYGSKKYNPKYRVNRLTVLFKNDFIGNIWKKKLFWEAGYQLLYIKQGYNKIHALNLDKINKNKAEDKLYPVDEPTMFDLYRQWGIIPENEAWGGLNSTLRFGLLYDTRDKEGAPSRGIWAEAHVSLSPKWLGTTHPHYRYSATFRHYLPIVKNDVLTFAYRLNYEGTFGNYSPYYAMPFITVMGNTYDRDGMGGYRTVRGMMRNRVQGLDMATYNAEVRWRFVSFTLWKQNIAFGLNVFSDGTMVTRGFDMSFKGDQQKLGDNYLKVKQEYDDYMALGQSSDYMHVTVGAGFRFIMNQNFIVCLEYGLPVGQLRKQDGSGAFYINTGYLF